MASMPLYEHPLAQTTSPLVLTGRFFFFFHFYRAAVKDKDGKISQSFLHGLLISAPAGRSAGF
jgi:hypothetical protein